MPMGASLAFKGIEESMIIIHGSQGCSTYIRRHIAAHYNEPVDIASSSLSEEGTVYGGEKNLKKGIKNLIKLYNPKVIGVLTTCLAETIGDDIIGIVHDIREEFPDIKADIIPVATPGYGASQTEGYYYALRRILEYYSSDASDKNNSINIIVSNVTCEDIRELKRILSYFKLDYTIFPDISDALDAPYTNNYNKLSNKGTKIEQIKKMSGAAATIEFGTLINNNHSPGKYLEEEYGVKLYKCPIPIGIENTDKFIEILCELSNMNIPEILIEERGRMLDAMIDSHKYNGIGRAAIYGDMEIVYSISCLCMENGIKPIVIATGTKNNNFNNVLQEKVSNDYKSIILNDTDFDTIRENINKNYVNIMIGNSEGKYIWEKDEIDLVRVGFPVHDNVGAQRKRLIGYKGSTELLDSITNTLLNNKHLVYRKTMYDQYYLDDSSFCFV
jgi:nitrogenase molybdenum-iron protein NifN